MNFHSLPSPDVSQPPQSPKPDEPTDWLLTNASTGATDEPSSHEVASCFPFDKGAALARVGGEHDLLRQMTGLFAMQWKNLCDEITKAGEQRDGTTLELAANKLKRSVESLGAGAMSRLAQELEVRGHDSDFHDMARICKSLQKEIERLVNALREFTKEEMLIGSRS